MKRRIVSIFLVIAMLCTCMPQITLPVHAAATSGSCGENLTWSFAESTGELRITGFGDMQEWHSSNDVPWYAFNNQILTVSLSESVTSIGNCAFASCSKLTSIVIPVNVTSIGFYAFNGCSSLTDITIPDGVTSIDNSAFNGCSGLTSLIIPDSVTSIGGYTFRGCAGLTSITIPDGVTSIDSYTFADCANLKSITIPDSVTSIGSSAFEGCTGLTNITIPESVTSIGNYLFYGCSSLTSITIPESVTSIGNYSFYGCSSLTSITIPERVMSVGNNAFSQCSELTNVTILDGVKSIGSNAFAFCSKLTSVEVPNTVTSIGNSAFRSTGLSNIMLPNSLTSIGDYAFQYSDLMSITIPERVMSVGNNAFSQCSELTNVTILDGVKSIGSNAFAFCSKLTSVEVPNTVTSIGNSAFQSTGLSNIMLPNSLTSIGDYAFQSTGLSNIMLPNSLTSIGDYAFQYSDLTSITIPNSVTSIGRSAFGSCNFLNSITIQNRNCSIYADAATLGSADRTIIFGYSNSTAEQYAENCNYSFSAIDGQSYAVSGICGDDLTWSYDEDGKALTITGSGNMFAWSRSIDVPWALFRDRIQTISLPEGLTSIGDCAFADCTNIKSITIPDSVTSIGEKAFERCSKLNRVMLPNGLTSLGNNAFANCIGLTSIMLPNGLTSIGAEVFYYCDSLASVTIPDSVTSIEKSAFYYCSSLTDIVIPNSVTSIGETAFYGCGLTSITIPNSVTSIDRNAFTSCEELTSVVIPDSVTSIGIGAFYGCSSLTSITLPESVTSIGDGMFVFCSSLSSVTILSNISSIGNSMFSSCDSLTNVIIPDSVTSIGKAAFNSCSSLTDITIPDGVTSIGDSAFSGCSSLTSITIPDGVTSIGKSMFYRCSNLTNVTIPGSVTSIGDYAFGDCDMLSDVWYSGTEMDWLNIAIGKEDEPCYDAKIHLNAGSDVVTCEHNYIEETITVTCTTAGYTEGICTECADRYIAHYTFPLGHNYQIGKCSNCGDDLAVEILEDVETETEIEEAGQYRYFLFTPEFTERYTICSIGDKNTYGYLYDDTRTMLQSNDNSGDYDNFSISEILTAGKTYRIAARLYSGSDTGSFSVVLSVSHNYVEESRDFDCLEGGTAVYECSFCGLRKTGQLPAGHDYVNGICSRCGDDLAEEITEGSEKEAVIETEGQYQYYCFTPEFTESYTICSTGGNDTYGYLYDDTGALMRSNDDGGNNYNFSITETLTAGKTYRIAAKIYSGSTGSFVVTLTGNHNYSEESRTYTCTTAGEVVYVCRSCGKTKTEQVSARHDYVNGICSQCGDDLAEEITVDSEKEAVIDIAGQYLYYRFTPGFTESYTICSTGGNDTYGYLYDDTGKLLKSDDQSGTYNNFSITETLTAGKTYRIAVRFYSSGSTGSFKVALTGNHDYVVIESGESTCTTGGEAVYACSICGKTKTEQIAPTGHNYENGVCTRCGDDLAIEITEGAEMEAVVEAAGQYLYYRFTPEFTESYTICSTGSKDTYGYLYDDAGKQIKTNDDSGEGSNFSITETLTAGKTYRIAARLYSSSSTGSFTISLIGNHDFVIESGEYTCTTGGEAIYVCSNCGKTKTEQIAPTGHSYVNGICSRCGDDIAIDITEGAEIEAVINSPAQYCYYRFTPDYTESYTFYSAYSVGSRDTYAILYDEEGNELQINDDISQDNLNFSITETLTAGKTYRIGVRICTLGTGSFPVILKGNHDYHEVSGTYTCTTAGEAEYICNNCGKTKTEQIYAPGHDYVNGICSRCGLVQADEVTAGECGEHLVWEFNSVTGQLSIYGYGEMDSYSSTNTPWNSIRSSILSVVINPGLTAIGDYAFNGCNSLTSATIPDSVTRIGSSAFSSCSSLTSVTIPDGVTSIGDSAFSWCSSLTSMTIPGNVTRIGNRTFEHCSSLSSVTIPNGIMQIGDYAFMSCSSLTSVTLPNSARYIGEHSFQYCSKLSGVILPDGVMSIRDYTFNGCTNLKSVEIPESIDRIGSFAFASCRSLTSVRIPNSVTSIDHYAFSYCEDLSNITLPCNLQRINKETFYGCSNLTSITIPESVQFISGDAFGNCTRMTEIIVHSGNEFYSGCDGVLFNKDMTELVKYPCGKSGDYQIPNSVTSIGASAFLGCSLACVTIPNSVTSIGDDAFLGCNSLTNMTIPDSVTSIGMYAFSDCSGLTTVTISDSITNISSSMFRNCSSLTSISIPDSVTNIGQSVFSDCTNLIIVVILNKDCAIDSYFYSGLNSNALICGYSDSTAEAYAKQHGYSFTAIDAFDFSCGDDLTWSFDESSGKLTITGSGEMDDWSAWTNVPWCIYQDKIQTVILPDGLTSIGQNAFAHAVALTNVTIPDRVTSIGGAAFLDCSGLTSMTIPDSVTTIGSSAFRDCSGLTNITIPDGVMSIGDFLFYGCSNLTSITIPDGVTSIGWNAFYGCTGLSSITIPESVTSISRYAFENCSSLASVTINNNACYIESYSTTLGSADTTVIHGYLNSSAESYAMKYGYVFSWIEGQEAIAITEGSETEAVISSAGQYQYYSFTPEYTESYTICSIGDKDTYGYLYDDTGKLLMSNGNSGFLNDNFSITATLTAGKTYRIAVRLYSSSSIGSFIVALTGNHNYVEESRTYTCTEDGEAVYICSNCGKTITEQVAAKHEFVNGICSLCGAEQIEQGECGEHLTWEFNYVTGHLSIFGEGEMENYSSSTWLGGILAPWNDLYSLIESIEISSDVTTIGECAFYGCSGLTSITIPESVTSIGDSAFSGCSSLTSITIPNSVTSIGWNAFYGCSSLTSVTIQNGVKSIGGYAFSGCNSLTSITIPESVTSIDCGAFENCSNLERITILSRTCSIYTDGKTLGSNDSTLICGYLNSSAERYAISCGHAFSPIDGQPIPEIAEGSEVEAVIGSAGQYQTYRFTPEYTESYTICSTGSKDTYGNLYDDTGKRLASNDDGGVNGNFSITATLTARKTYQIIVRLYSSSATGSFNVVLTGNHNYVEERRTNTCTEDGEAVYVCSNCGKTVTEQVAALGHAFVDGICSRCGAEQIEQGQCGENLSWEFNYVTGKLSIFGEGEMENYASSSWVIAFFGGELAPWDDIRSLIESVEISSGVTTIGDNAFVYCRSLTSASIPESVTSIGNYAFACCDSLTRISIPENVTGIGNQVFANDTNLAQVDLPNGLTSIGNNAFAACTNLRTIDIPNSVVSIADWAFIDSGLTEVYLPDSVTVIGENPFDGCKELKSITVSENNPNYCAADNVLYSADMTELICCPAGMAEVTIPESVTTIGRDAFGGCVQLTSVEIPNQVTVISPYAFSNCSNLESVELPDSITIIDEYSFQGCEKLRSVSIPQSVETIGRDAFDECSNLESIELPDSLTVIDEFAFYGCEKLRSIWIPQKVETIGRYAFEWCSGLERIEIPVSVTSISQSAFFGCNILSEVFYTGSEEDWSKIEILSSNDPLLNATIRYNYTVNPDVDFTDPGDASKIWIINRKNAAIEEGVGLTLVATRPAFEDCNGQNTGDQATNPEDVIEVPVDGDWTATLEFDFSTGTARNAYYQFFGFYASEGNDFQNMGGIRGGSGAMEDFLRMNGTITVDSPGISSAPGIASEGTYWYQIRKEGSTYTCLRSDDGEEFTEMFVYEETGIEADRIVIDAYTGMTEGYQFTLKSLNIRDSSCEHEYSTVVTEPTCTEGGYTTYTCSKCGDSYVSDEVEPLGHDLQDHEAKAPTCTEIGWDAYQTCARCDYSTYTEKAALGHYLIDSEAKAPNCTEIGWDAYQTCSRCDYSTYEEKAALGHDLQDHAAKAPNCTEIGWDAYQTCSRCDYSTYEEKAALGHDLQDYADKAPSCTEIGWDTYQTCSRCDYTTYVELPALGHAFGSWYEAEAPICTEKGTERRDCARCDVYETRQTDALGHDYSDTVTEPTCTEKGYTTHSCTRCTYSYKDTYMDALGHIFGSWYETKAPTCTGKGMERRECARCDVYETRQTDALGHDFGDWTVTKEATILVEGSEQRVCRVCDHIEKRAIPRVGIDPEIDTNYGIANFTVLNAQTKKPIAGAGIFVSTENDGETTLITDANGEVSVALPIGEQLVSVYADGCLTRNIRITVSQGVNDIAPIGLSDMPVYDATLKSHLMSREEIKEAGIDTTASANQNVYKYELTLNFEAEIDAISLISYWGDTGLGDLKIISGGEPDEPDRDSDVVWVPPHVETSSGHFYLPEHETSIYPISENFYLIVRGSLCWLKEMFDVEMLVINNSQTDTLEDVTAELELPEGLALAAMENGAQALSQQIGTIGESESRSVHWYVRGDEAGNYKLKAHLGGKVMPFDEPIDQSYVCEEPIQVLGGDALRLDFEFPSAAYYAEDYPITITLTNVSDIPLYNITQMIQAEQGMEIFYNNGTTEEKIETTVWHSLGEEFVLEPGDKIIVRTSVNVFFESRIMERWIESLQGIVTGIERLKKAIDSIDIITGLLSSFTKTISKCSSAIDTFLASAVDIDQAKMDCFRTIYNNMSKLMLSYSKSENSTVNAAIEFANTGLSATLNSMADDTDTWVRSHATSDLRAIAEKTTLLVDKLGSSQDSESFNIYDSIRTAISAIPIRFALNDVVLTEKAGSTAKIPSSYSVTEASPHYFGVSNVSKYLMSLVIAAGGEAISDALPFYAHLIPGIDDNLDVSDAIRYIKATEDEIAMFKAKDATGEVTFEVWVERAEQKGGLLKTAGRTAQTSNGFELSCDNDTAVYENGVLKFKGDTAFTLTPTGTEGGTLYVRDSEGNLYTYVIDVVPQHTCVEGDWETIISPTNDNDGIAVKRCSICGEITDINTLSADMCGQEHSFSEWTIEIEAGCTTPGLRSRVCSVCGLREEKFIEALGHSYVDHRCTRCGEKEPDPIDENTVISVGNARSMPGKTITVPVSIEKNPGFAGFTFEITADEGLTLMKISKAGILGESESGAMTPNVAMGQVNWTNYCNDTGDGELLLLTFAVDENAEDGEYHVRVALKDGATTNFVNEDQRAILTSFEVGTVTVSSVIYGCINNDNDITSADSVMLVRYLVEMEKFTAQQLRAADVNHDGDVTAADAVVLARYLVGLIDTLDEPENTMQVLSVGTPSINGAAVDAETVSGQKGDTVTVTVSIHENSGFAGFSFRILHSSDICLKSIKKGSLLKESESGAFTVNVDKDLVNWTDSMDLSGDGVLMELTFELMETGTYEIGLEMKDQKASNFVNADGNVIAAELPTGDVVTMLNSFIDLPDADNWAYAGIDYCVRKGMMKGVSDELFNPSGTVTRAQLVTILYRMAGEHEAAYEGCFTDVEAGKWYTDAVEWAFKNGIVNGIGSGRFAPDDPVTREQIAVILYRYAGCPVSDGALNEFYDAATVSAYALEAMDWAVSVGLINGVASDTTVCLAPKRIATRAQIAAILKRFNDIG